MATAPQPINRSEWEEVKAPEMFKFERQGQEIEGELIDIDQVQVNDKPTMQYTMRLPNGTRLTFLGTNDLNKKIEPNLVHCHLKVRYETDDTSFQKPGQSPAKVFKVLVKRGKSAA